MRLKKTSNLALQSTNLINYHRLFEFRKNGIKSIAGGKLYLKLKNKRTNNEKKTQLLDWKKLVRNEFGAIQTKIISPLTSAIARKKAIPLDVVGETFFEVPPE